MKIRLLLWGLLLFFVFDTSQAQRLNPRQRYNRNYFKNVVKAYSDYLDKKTAQYWLPDSTGRVYQPNVEINPIYYRLFTPVTVYHSTVLRA